MIRSSLILSLVLGTAVFSHAEAIPESAKVGDFFAGAQAWSFNAFTVMEAIEKTAAAGGKTIEFFPGQKLSPENPAKFDQNATPEMRAAVKAKLKEQGITPVGFGVTHLTNVEADTRKVFEFAKDMGIGIIVSEPADDALDLIEKLVKEYDIKMAIHNHPKRPLQPSYRYWDPEYVLSLVKNRDARMGSCADIGHWVRSGLKPVDCIRLLKGRIFDSHVKDLTEFGNPKAHDVPFGTGVSGITEVLNEYEAIGFHGPIDVEYEYHQKEGNVDEVKQCLDFVKAFKPTTKLDGDKVTLQTADGKKVRPPPVADQAVAKPMEAVVPNKAPASVTIGNINNLPGIKQEAPPEFIKLIEESPDAFKADKYEKGKVYSITGKSDPYFQILQVTNAFILIVDARRHGFDSLALLIPEDPKVLESVNIATLDESAGGATSNVAPFFARAAGRFAGFKEIETRAGTKRLPTFVIPGLNFYTGKFTNLK